MPSDDRVEQLIAESLRALKAAEAIPPAEGFERMVRAGLITRDGRLNREKVEEVPVRVLLEHEAATAGGDLVSSP